MTDIRKAGVEVGLIRTPAHRRAIISHLLQSHDKPKHVFVEQNERLTRTDTGSSTLWIVFDGSIELTLNDSLYKLRKDWFAYIPNGIEYTFENRSNSTVRLVEQSGPVVDSTESQLKASYLANLISRIEHVAQPIGNRPRRPFQRVTEDRTYVGSPTVRMILAQAHPYAIVEATLAIRDKENSEVYEEIAALVNADSVRRRVPEQSDRPWAYEMYRRKSEFWPLYLHQLDTLQKTFIFALAGLQTEIAQMGFTDDEIDEIYRRAPDVVFGLQQTTIIHIQCPSVEEMPDSIDELTFYVLDADIRAWSGLISKFERGVRRYPADIPIKPKYEIEAFENIQYATFEPQNRPSPHIDEKTAFQIVSRTIGRNLDTIQKLLVEQDRAEFVNLMNKLF